MFNQPKDTKTKWKLLDRSSLESFGPLDLSEARRLVLEKANSSSLYACPANHLSDEWNEVTHIEEFLDLFQANEDDDFDFRTKAGSSLTCTSQIALSRWKLLNRHTQEKSKEMDYVDLWNLISKSSAEELSHLFVLRCDEKNSEWTAVRSEELLKKLVEEVDSKAQKLREEKVLKSFRFQNKYQDLENVNLRRPGRGNKRMLKASIELSDSAVKLANSNREERPEDRRKHPRYELDIPLQITHRNRVGKAQSRNLSIGGSRLGVKLPIELDGQNVEVTVQHPSLKSSAKKLKIQATARVSKNGVSRLIFDEPSEFQLSQLKSIISAELKKTLN